uniref:MYND-type domain-containing protein n=1 Tax=Magallana gigas TaxID=29159 RepID=A0A8W8KIH8_MAGGI
MKTKSKNLSRKKCSLCKGDVCIHEHGEKMTDTLQAIPDMAEQTMDLLEKLLKERENNPEEILHLASRSDLEVKRQAMLELQKAVSAAEQKATEMVSAERIKMERSMSDSRKKIREEVMAQFNHQEESSESCWNCGRKASETCSGCNVARYCGSFCQHKDWENHHHVCGKSQVSMPETRPDRASSTVHSSPQPKHSPGQTVEVTAPQSSLSPSGPATSSPKTASRSSTPPEKPVDVIG